MGALVGLGVGGLVGLCVLCEDDESQVQFKNLEYSRQVCRCLVEVEVKQS